MKHPLDNIKVLDLCRWGPGSYCTMILGDLGAQVLKVESPGNLASYEGPGFCKSPSERKLAARSSLNRNKSSLALDLKKEAGRRVFRELAIAYDVVVEDFRPGGAERLGVDYETMRHSAPQLVYCSISGYGQSGPYRDLPGHDLNYVALGGVLGLTSDAETPPPIPINVIGNYAAGGLNAVIGILAAMRVKEHTGAGQHVDTSMVDGVISLLTELSSSCLSLGSRPKWRERISSIPGCYEVYRTKDAKYISIGCVENWAWGNLCRALGREDFTPHLFAEGQLKQEIRSCFQEIFLTRTRDEWFAFLRENGANVAPVYDMDEVFADPHVVHRAMVVDVDCPEVGVVRQVGSALKLSETPAAIGKGAPVLGEDTDEALKDIGYSDDDIGELRKKGVIA